MNRARTLLPQLALALAACSSDATTPDTTTPDVADGVPDASDAADEVAEPAPDVGDDAATPDSAPPEGDVVAPACHREGISGRAGYQDEPGYVGFSIVELATNSVLLVQFNRAAPSPFRGVGTYPFASNEADRDFDTCGLCPFISTDCDGGPCGRIFFATSGQIRVTTFDEATGAFEAVIEDAVFAELEVVDGNAGALKPGGERWCLPKTSFARSDVGGACDSDDECDLPRVCNSRFGVCGACRSSGSCPLSRPVCALGDDGPVCSAKGDICQGDDAFEPNDTLEDATTLTLPTGTLRANACYSDWYTFTVDADGELYAFLSWSGSATLGIGLYEADGDELMVSTTDSGEDVVWVDEARRGKYHVQVFQDDLAVLEGIRPPTAYTFDIASYAPECSPDGPASACDDGNPCTVDACSNDGECIRSNPCSAPAGLCQRDGATYACACTDPDALGPRCVDACPGGQHLDGDAYEPNECAAQATPLTVSGAGGSARAHAFTIGPMPSDVDFMRATSEPDWVYWVLTDTDDVCPIADEALAAGAAGPWTRAGQVSGAALASGWSCAEPAGASVAAYDVGVIGFPLDPDFSDLSFDPTEIAPNRTAVANTLGDDGDSDTIEFEADVPFTLYHAGQGLWLRAVMVGSPGTELEFAL